jgi:hypothetical protein
MVRESELSCQMSGGNWSSLEPSFRSWRKTRDRGTPQVFARPGWDPVARRARLPLSGSDPTQTQHRLDADEQMRLVAAYLAGDTVGSLASMYQLHRGTVSEILSRHGVTNRPHGLVQEPGLVTIYFPTTSRSSLSRLAAMDSTTGLVPLIQAPPSLRTDWRISSKGPQSKTSVTTVASSPSGVRI